MIEHDFFDYKNFLNFNIINETLLILILIQTQFHIIQKRLNKQTKKKKNIFELLRNSKQI